MKTERISLSQSWDIFQSINFGKNQLLCVVHIVMVFRWNEGTQHKRVLVVPTHHQEIYQSIKPNFIRFFSSILIGQSYASRRSVIDGVSVFPWSFLRSLITCEEVTHLKSNSIYIQICFSVHCSFSFLEFSRRFSYYARLDSVLISIKISCTNATGTHIL